jgi:hypothetical protein
VTGRASRRVAALAAFVLALVVAVHVAAARPGGGHSFSGGHSSGGGHSSSGGHYSGGHYSGGSYYGSGGGLDGGVVLLFVVLAVVVFGVPVIARAMAQSRTGGVHIADTWAQSYTPTTSFTPPPARVNVAAIAAVDPAFSVAVFEDFAYQLYAAAHLARADAGKLAALAPYLSPAAAAWLQSRQSAPPRAVVVAALQVEGGKLVGDHLQLDVKVEANLAGDDTLYVVEHWRFVRAVAVQTKPPVRVHTWPCPNCGAPWQANAQDANACAYCGQVVAHGKFDWQVETIRLESQRSVGPTLTGTVDEEGTDLPTIVAPDAREAWKQLQADDPAVTWDAFTARVGLVYQRMNEGWNALDLTPARGLVTTAMLDFLRYWTEEYKRQGLRNRLDDASIDHVVLAKVRRDTYFDAVTVRVFASGHDFTVDAKDHVVGGSRDDDRAYTEYWTFLRASTRRGPIVSEPNCPNCGAPLAVAADSGACTHCNAVIDNGSFDFVLSKIEQDEVYSG